MKLKKLLSILLVMCMILPVVPVMAQGEITVIVDGEKVIFDQPPIIENGRTMVPVRAIFEKLGAKVSYEPVRQKVYAEIGTKYVAFLVGADTIYTNEGGYKIDTPSKIINDRTLVPVRAVSEGFGALVKWDDATRTVYITSNRGTNNIRYEQLPYVSYYMDQQIVLQGVCEYPVIESDNAVIKALNEKFKAGATDYCMYLSTEPNNLATQTYKKYIEGDKSAKFYPVEYKRTFDISYNKDNIVSFEFYTMAGYNGVFSSNRVKNGLTYDISTGETIGITDVLSIPKEEVDEIVKDMFLRLVETMPTSFKADATEYINTKGAEAEFYLNDYGVMFFLPEGAISNDPQEISSVFYPYDGNEITFKVTNFKKVSDEITPPVEQEPDKEDNLEDKTDEENTSSDNTEPPIDDKDKNNESEKEDIVEPKEEEIVNDMEYSVSFADEIYSRMPQDKNYMFSPLSIKMALGLLVNGANGDTQREIMEVMQIRTVEEFNAVAKDLIEIFNHSDSVSFNVANSVWLNTDRVAGGSFESSYEDKVKEYYNAVSGKVTDATAVSTVNNWVKSNTNNKIKSIISDEDFAAALVNAVYFKASWQNKFREAATHTADFADKNGKIHSVEFMRQLDRFDYHKDGTATVVELPYSNVYEENGIYKVNKDMDISMYVVMPKFDTKIENVEDYLNKVTLKSEYLDISMPKFKTEYSTSLKEVLKSMGMEIVFGEYANLKDMSNTDMFVDKIFHKTYVEVDESGTEAAASTAVVTAPTSALITNEPIEIKINNPFVYVIKDNVSGEILFIGEYAYVE